MVLLHKPNWRKIEDLNNTNETWMQVFTNFLTVESCPNFVLADVERARRHEESKYCSDEEEVIDSSPIEQPEWMDLLAPNPDFDYINCPDFVYDDGGHDYNWSSENIPYPEDKGTKFIEGLNLQLESDCVFYICTI